MYSIYPTRVKTSGSSKNVTSFCMVNRRDSIILVSFRECRLPQWKILCMVRQTRRPPSVAASKALFSRAPSARTAHTVYTYIFYVYDLPYSSVTAEAFCTRVPVLRRAIDLLSRGYLLPRQEKYVGEVFLTRFKRLPALHP